MPEPNRPRPNPPKPPQYAGFEVVDDEPAPPPRAAAPRPKPLPPLPGERPAAPAATPTPSVAKPTPAPRPAPPAKAAPPAKPVPAKPAFEVVDDHDTEVVPAAKAKTVEVRKPARADEDDARPRKGRAATDGGDDDRTRKKKGKKGTGKAKTAEEHNEELRERRLREFEIVWPTVLLVIGVVMSFSGALGASGLSGFLTIGVMVVGLLISIPVTICTLMVVGMVAGINYGRFGPAVLKIAAITFVVNGVYFIGEWFKVPLFVIGPIGCAVAFGLFKTQFDLDNQETNTSMGALNVVTFAAKVVIMIFLVAAEAKLERDTDPDRDDDNPFPTETRRDRGRGKNQPPVTAPAADPDDDDPDDDDF